MEEKNGKMSEEMLGKIIIAINILRSSGKIDSLNTIAQTMHALKGKLDDEQIFFILKEVDGDGRIAKIIILSGCLSEEGALTLLKDNHFDQGLCENALDTYPGDEFAKALFEKAGEDQRLLKIISSAKISPELKMLLAIKSKYDPSFCRGDACSAAASLLAAIAA